MKQPNFIASIHQLGAAFRQYRSGHQLIIDVETEFMIPVRVLAVCDAVRQELVRVPGGRAHVDRDLAMLFYPVRLVALLTARFIGINTRVDLVPNWIALHLISPL